MKKFEHEIFFDLVGTLVQLYSACATNYDFALLQFRTSTMFIMLTLILIIIKEKVI